MKNIWAFFGRAAFWLTLPLLHVYLKHSKRTRILIMVGKEILVVKGWLNDGTWSLPGGGLHRREDPAKGALRELAEETGIRISPENVTEIGKAKQNQHGLKFVYFQFSARLESKVPIKPSRWEIIDARWMPISELSADNAQAHVLDTIAAAS